MMHRRHFLATTAVALVGGRAAAAGTRQPVKPGAGSAPVDPVRAYLRPLVRTRQQVEDFVSTEQTPERRGRNRGFIYDAELGWVLTDAVRPDGVDGSKTFYHYEADGARKIVNCPDRPAHELFARAHGMQAYLCVPAQGPGVGSSSCVPAAFLHHPGRNGNCAAKRNGESERGR